MSRKIDRHGPSTKEVILGAVLSLVLGAALAAVFLVLKPVAVVNALPKEPAANTVYFIEGSRSGSSQATAKMRAFAQGQSISLNEDELNAILGHKPAAAPAPAGKPGEKAAAAKMFTPGELNFRVRNGELQMGLPVQVAAFGLIDAKVIVQARGTFEKSGDRFVFEPSEFYVGSCPVQRLPVVSSLILKRAMAVAEVPTEVTAAWDRLADVKVAGATLQLTMP